jgi:ABC-type nitrate/sulfonate/bicarbonate transport system substrate-binding protein
VVWATHLQLFSKKGLDLRTKQTASSDELGQGLADGTWDAGIGVIDNIISWNRDLSADLQVIAQLERSTLMAFCGLPSYISLKDAAGGKIGVDSTTMGFIMVGYRAFAKAGIDWRHCRYEPVGGVRQRFEALESGDCDSTILVPPFIDMAVAKGFKKLWSGETIAPNYPGVVVAGRRSWLNANEHAVRGYLGALEDANSWASKMENAKEAVGALMASRYSEVAAKNLVARILPDLRPSLPGWQEVVSLRREAGMLPSPAPKAEDIMETKWLKNAS